MEDHIYTRIRDILENELYLEKNEIKGKDEAANTIINFLVGKYFTNEERTFRTEQVV